MSSENLIQRGIVLAEEGRASTERWRRHSLIRGGVHADGSLKERVEMAMEVTEIENIREALASAGGRREAACADTADKQEEPLQQDEAVPVALSTQNG